MHNNFFDFRLTLGLHGLTLRLAGEAVSETGSDRKGRSRDEDKASGRHGGASANPGRAHRRVSRANLRVGGGGYGVGFRKEVESGADGAVSRKGGGTGTAGDAEGGPRGDRSRASGEDYSGLFAFLPHNMPNLAARDPRKPGRTHKPGTRPV